MRDKFRTQQGNEVDGFSHNINDHIAVPADLVRGTFAIKTLNKPIVDLIHLKRIENKFNFSPLNTFLTNQCILVKVP